MAKLRAQQADRMANGLILLIFGFLFLLIELRIINHWLWKSYISSPATFFVIAGLLSVWLKRKKTLGYILTTIGVFGYADLLFHWSGRFSLYAFPSVVMATGVIMIIFTKLKIN